SGWRVRMASSATPLTSMTSSSSIASAPCREDLTHGAAIRPEVVALAGLPLFAQAGLAEVPIGPDLLEDRPEVPAKVLGRRPAPIPVAVVDLGDAKARSQDQGVRRHRVVVRVGVLGDVEILLDDALGV